VRDGGVLEFREGHGLRVSAWIGYSEGYAYVAIWVGKFVPFCTVLLHSAFRLFSCLLLSGITALPEFGPCVCVCVGVRKALRLLWQARKRWMGMRLFRISSGDARVACLGFGCDPCSTYLGAVQNLRGPPRELGMLLT